MLINRYETSEPVLDAKVEVEAGNTKAVAKFQVARQRWPEAFAQDDRDRSEHGEDADNGESVGCAAGHAAARVVGSICADISSNVAQPRAVKSAQRV